MQFSCAVGVGKATDADREALEHHLSLIKHSAEAAHSRVALAAHGDVKLVIDQISAQGDARNMTAAAMGAAFEALASMDTALQTIHPDLCPAGLQALNFVGDCIELMVEASLCNEGPPPAAWFSRAKSLLDDWIADHTSFVGSLLASMRFDRSGSAEIKNALANELQRLRALLLPAYTTTLASAKSLITKSLTVLRAMTQLPNPNAGLQPFTEELSATWEPLSKLCTALHPLVQTLYDYHGFVVLPENLETDYHNSIAVHGKTMYFVYLWAILHHKSNGNREGVANALKKLSAYPAIQEAEKIFNHDIVKQVRQDFNMPAGSPSEPVEPASRCKREIGKHQDTAPGLADQRVQGQVTVSDLVPGPAHRQGSQEVGRGCTDKNTTSVGVLSVTPKTEIPEEHVEETRHPPVEAPATNATQDYDFDGFSGASGNTPEPGTSNSTALGLVDANTADADAASKATAPGLANTADADAASKYTAPGLANTADAEITSKAVDANATMADAPEAALGLADANTAYADAAEPDSSKDTACGRKAAATTAKPDSSTDTALAFATSEGARRKPVRCW